MSAFKDIVSNDIDNVFINDNEFGELFTIDGRQLSILVDNDRLKERSKKEYDGISVGEILFFVAKEQFGSRPEQGTPMMFEDQQMYVFDVREDMGLYEIILSQNRGV